MKSLLVWLGVIILIICLIFLVSCSSGGKWVKPDGVRSEFEEDYNQCRGLARRECGYTQWPGYVVQKTCIDDYIEDCLHSRGWEYRKE